MNSKFLPNTWCKFVVNIYDAQLEGGHVSPHKCLSAFTLGHMWLDKSLDTSSDLRPSEKAL